jgi:serine/threonine protein kinase
VQAGREVAIKRISLRGLSAEEVIEATDTFNREASVLSSLRHPQIPQIYDQFSDQEHWYLVLQYLEGPTLEAYLEMRTAEGKPLQFDEVLEMALQLGEVLNYLHTRQPPVIFRDLKPSNIIRTPSKDILCLVEFGIARRFRFGQKRDTQALGSPGYAAPEQYGRAQTTPRCDIYSLGALLHFLLSGQDPAETSPVLTPLHLNAETGAETVSELVQRTLSPDPELRPATMSEVIAVLEDIQKQRAAQPAAHIGQSPAQQNLPSSPSQRVVKLSWSSRPLPVPQNQSSLAGGKVAKPSWTTWQPPVPQNQTQAQVSPSSPTFSMPVPSNRIPSWSAWIIMPLVSILIATLLVGLHQYVLSTFQQDFCTVTATWDLQSLGDGSYMFFGFGDPQSTSYSIVNAQNQVLAQGSGSLGLIPSNSSDDFADNPLAPPGGQFYDQSQVQISRTMICWYSPYAMQDVVWGQPGEPSDGWVWLLWFLSAAAIPVLLYLCILRLIIYSWQLARRGIQTTGTVVDCVRHRTRYGYYYITTVSFQTNTTPHLTGEAKTRGQMPLGSKMDVCYDPLNPLKNRKVAYNFDSDDATKYAFGGIMLILLLLGGLALVALSTLYFF